MRPAGSSRSPAEPDGLPARPTEVAFAPSRLGGGSGRREPAIAVGIVAALFVGLAVAKPWDRGGPAGIGAAPSASVAPSTSVARGSIAAGTPRDPGPVPTPEVGPIRVAPPPIVSWDDVAPALTAHDGWGVRALVDTPNLDGGIRPGYATLAERWEPAAPAIDGALGSSLGGAIQDAVVMPTSGQAVRVLGFTAPMARTPLDARVWWIRPDGDPLWLDVRSVDPAVAGGHLLLLPPWLADGSAARWPEGTYRVDLLLGADLTRLVVVLPADGRAPGPAGDPFDGSPAVGPAPINPRGADLAGLEPGPFVLADGAAVSVESVLGPPQAEAAAWLDAAPGPPGSRAAAEVWLPGINGIGFVLPVGARLEWAAIERLTAVRLTRVDAAARQFSDVRGRFVTVLFSPPNGQPWSLGTYALDVRWTEEGVRREGRWHVALLPGPARRTGAWTGLARGWARHAGTWGIVTGTAEPLDGGPSSAAIRFLPQEPGTVSPDPASLGEGCTGGGLIDVSKPVIGIAHAVDAPIRSVRLERWFVGGRRIGLPVSAARNVVPGLSIVGPSVEVPWPPGYYRLIIETAGPEARLVVCLGEVGRSGSRAFPATASAEAYVAGKAASIAR